MSTVIKRDGPAAPWRSPLNVRGYIRARKGGLVSGGGEFESALAGFGIDGSFSFFSAPLGYIVSEAREGSIKIISDALMRNYEGLSFFIFSSGFVRNIIPLSSVKKIFISLYSILYRARILEYKG